MKALVWLIVLGVLIGGGYYIGFYKPEQEKKAKIEAEVRAKAEADKKAAEEKARAEAEKAETEKKAAEAKKAEAEKKLTEEKKVEQKASESAKQAVDSSIEIKKNTTEIANIKKALENFKPETCKINPVICQKAADLQSKITDILKQANDKKSEIAELEKSKKRASQELRTARSTKEAKGWRWKDEPDSVCRPMSQLPKHRTKGVEYVYAKDDRGDKAAAEVQKKIEVANADLKKFEEQYNNVKSEYQSIFETYKKELEKKLLDLTEANKRLAVK